MIRSFFKKLFSLKLHWQIFIALALGVLAGVLTGEEKTLFNIVTFYSIFDFLGTLFLRALKMIIVPLITSSIITGVSGVGSSGSLGKIGAKTFLYYITTSMLAILVGLMLVNFLTPGIDDGSPVKDKLGLTADASGFEEEVTEEGADALVNIFIRMIPTNPDRKSTRLNSSHYS